MVRDFQHIDWLFVDHRHQMIQGACHLDQIHQAVRQSDLAGKKNVQTINICLGPMKTNSMLVIIKKEKTHLIKMLWISDLLFSEAKKF